MLTTVKGTRDKKLKKLLALAAQHYCDRLMSKRLVHNISIIVQLKRDIEEDGFCEIQEYNRSGKPREFLIELNKDLNHKSLLLTLAHECVHVKQYAMGELDDNLSVWRGKKVDSDKVPYWDHPWEVEAHGRERGLYVRFAQAHELGQIENQSIW